MTQSVAWLVLLVAGLCEIGWAVGLKYTEGFSRLWPSVGTVAAMIASVLLLGLALKALPLGTAYAVWTGIGAVGTAILGIYLGFQMVVLAALRARLKGWVPSGAFTLGRWGLPVTIAALVYGVLTMVNIAWPRTPDAPWYDNYLVALSALVGVGLGALYLLVARPHERSHAPHADAVPTENDPAPTP